jgi:hypothetical protein
MLPIRAHPGVVSPRAGGGGVAAFGDPDDGGAGEGTGCCARAAGGAHAASAAAAKAVRSGCGRVGGNVCLRQDDGPPRRDSGRTVLVVTEVGVVGSGVRGAIFAPRSGNANGETAVTVPPL